MGTILNSKSFLVPKNEYMPLDAVRDWLHSVNTKDEDCLLTVKLEIAGKSKQNKKSATAELLELSCKAALENKEIWSQGEYKFFFVAKQYYWKGEEIYVTPNEALFLFKWLVLNVEVHKYQWYYLRNIRRRLGKDFLLDIQMERNQF
jgi:5-hydroxyisourate hydrolase-like protein (transthyretin family)